MDLFLTEYMCNKETTKYKLNGIISHIGASVNSGHYVAVMKGFDGHSWFKYDDALVCSFKFFSIKNLI